MQLLIQNQWVTGEAKRAERQGLRGRGQEALRAARSSRSQGEGLPGVPQDLRASPRRTLFRVASSSSPTSCARRSPRARTRSPTPRSRPTTRRTSERFAQPERRDLRIVLTKDKARAEAAKKPRSTAVSPGSRSPRSTRSTRPRRTRAASCSPWPRASRSRPRQGRLRRRQGQAHRPGQDAVRLVRLRGHQDHEVASQQSLQQASQTIKGILASENQQKALDKFIKDFQKEEGRDELPQGLRDAGLQERPEGQVRRPPPGRPAGPGLPTDQT